MWGKQTDAAGPHDHARCVAPECRADCLTGATRRRAPSFGALLLAAIAVGVSSARADTSLGPERSPIRTSRYAVDLQEGGVLGGTRSLALAGAYTALAHNTDGALQNPAAPAARAVESVHVFEFDLGVGITFPFFVRDLFNTSDDSQRHYEDTQFFFVAPTLNFQFDQLGLGITVRGQSFRLNGLESGVDPTQELRAQLFRVDPQVAYGFIEGQLILGVGGRFYWERVVAGDGAFIDNRHLYTGMVFGVQAGALWRPTGQRYRFGAAFRNSSSASPTPSDEVEITPEGDWVVNQTFYLPQKLASPWELELGAAYQFGPRPFNPPVRTVEAEAAAASQSGEDEAALHVREKEIYRQLRGELRKRARPYLLVSVTALVTGAIDNAVSVDGFLLQQVRRSGQSMLFSPRLGLEAEVWPNQLKARAGAYVEPSRIEGSSRLHVTLGTEIKLFEWSVFDIWPADYIWQLSAAVDLARDYFVWSLAIGGWY